jgi:hypothetical protein
LFQNELSKDWAQEAFKKAGVKSGDSYVRPHTEAARADLRACYTMVVDRYRWPTISANDKVWKLAQLTLGSALPEHIGLEMEKVVATNQDAEKSVVLLRADHMWEDALDKLNGTISFPFGNLHFRKRSASEHSKIRHAREAVEAKAASAIATATAKAAKKTAEADEAFPKAAENAIMNEGMDQSDGSANK